jgi:hypothetical protein
MNESSDKCGRWLTAINPPVSLWRYVGAGFDILKPALMTLGTTTVNLANLTRNLDRLSSADAVIADSYVRNVLNKAGFCALAGLIALLGLAISAISVLAPGEKLGAGRRFGRYRHSHLYVGRCLIRVRGAAEARTRVFVRIGREAIGDRSVGGGSSVRNELQLGNDALSGERGPHFRRRRALDGLTSPDAQGIESCQDRAAGRSEVVSYKTTLRQADRELQAETS